MAASLTDAYTQLRETLPCGPVTESTIDFVPASDMGAAVLGTLRTQIASAADLEVAVSRAAEGGKLRHIAAGGVVDFEIRIRSAAAYADARMVAAAGRYVQIVARLIPPAGFAHKSELDLGPGAGISPHAPVHAGPRLQAVSTPCADGSVTLTVCMPSDAPTGALVRIQQASLGRAAITRGIPADVLVAPSAAIAGMLARGFEPGAVSGWIPGVLDPIVVKYARYHQAPAVSDDGRLLVPYGLSVAAFSLTEAAPLAEPRLFVDADTLGAHDRTLGLHDVDDIGASNSFYAAAFDVSSRALLLGDSNGLDCHIYALNADTGEHLWIGACDRNCTAIAVLSDAGVAFIATEFNSGHGVVQARSLRPGDKGAVLAEAPCLSPGHLAVDPDTSSVFASMFEGPAGSMHSHGVCSWKWKGGKLVPQGLIRAAGLSHASRPLAVLDGQLVVGTRGADSLTVIALPGGQLLGYVRLPGVSLYALAAPPSGGTLVVLDAREGSSDAESAALILPWPPASGFYASPSQSSSR